MKIAIQKEELLKALSLVSGVVESRQTLAVLANVLFDVSGGNLTLTASDTEIEISSQVKLFEGDEQEGRITVPAKKLLEITKSLADNSIIQFSFDDGKVTLNSNRSRFTLSTLPADDFPSVDESDVLATFSLQKQQLAKLIHRSEFAMAQKDVRFYLNGMLFEVSPQGFRTVATDGHRLALSEDGDVQTNVSETVQIIVPYKGVTELARSLGEGDEEIQISIGQNHLTAVSERYTFITKLIDGNFPDYTRVIPPRGENVLIGSRHALREVFSRAAILSNEKFRGVRINLSDNTLNIRANNPEQEEAEDSIEVDYSGQPIEIGFNVTYLLDVVNALSGKNLKVSLSDGSSSALLEDADDASSLYVVMPMRL